MRSEHADTFEHSLVIAAPPSRVLSAFFDPVALAVWWQTVRSVTTPRLLGIYAVEWENTPFRDEKLGTLGGVFYGTVVEYRPGEEFVLAEAFWLAPEGEPVGPMGLEVSCTVEGPATRLRVVQSGYEESERWQRYYALIGPGWRTSMHYLKIYVEQGPSATRFARGERL